MASLIVLAYEMAHHAARWIVKVTGNSERDGRCLENGVCRSCGGRQFEVVTPTEISDGEVTEAFAVLLSAQQEVLSEGQEEG